MPLKEVDPIKVEAGEPSEKLQLEDMNDAFAQISHFGDGRISKMEVDYTAETDKQLNEANLKQKEGLTREAIEYLQQLEKKTRLDCDNKSNLRIVRHMVKLAFDGSQWDLLNETVKALSKKRALIKFNMTQVIRDCCEMIDKLPDEATKNTFIENLRSITAGKIYVEVERARLTKRVVDKLEAEGKIDEACDMIMEMQVETYGSMEITEKVKFLLHQMRLSIQKEQFTRATIISRKISEKFFDRAGEEVELMKLEYYKYMIQIGLHEESYLNVCKHFLCIFKTPKAGEDLQVHLELLKCIVFYLLLSPHDCEKWDLLQRINGMRELEKLPEHKELLKMFIKQELIFWEEIIEGKYSHILFGAKGEEKMFVDGPSSLMPQLEVFPMNKPEGIKRKERLHDCVGEHNVRMISKYYTRISFQQMAKLLEFSIEQMETFVCKLIVEGVIPDAKIHRPSQIIYLSPKLSTVDILDQWGSNIHKLTGIINKVAHLIVKEEMVHGMEITQKA
ncbi:PCI domain-containing protein [Meloidogyne graminicola]|uniref:PCI domain-containing protein n=1 Tax=Meloidogyne graminicola TaxID=189291 RepID=A0A8S9ZDQ6_9BILA|nr:PCI domain-containing protein [Meloidogyne graminicola]